MNEQSNLLPGREAHVFEHRLNQIAASAKIVH
jgi:hypothetical protein